MRNKLKRMPCGFCGMEIVVYDDDNPKSTPRRYCDGHCRNEAKKKRHREKRGECNMRVRLEPVNVCIDVEADSGMECVEKARAALEAAGFKPTEEGAYWVMADERAITGEDSGSPTHVNYSYATELEAMRSKKAGSEPKIVPYKCEPRQNPRKAYVRERDLANGGHIRIARFVEPGSEGECGVNITYLSPIKDGQRTELKFALSDEAAAATQWMLAEFFGIGMCA